MRSLILLAALAIVACGGSPAPGVFDHAAHTHHVKHDQHDVRHDATNDARRTLTIDVYPGGLTLAQALERVAAGGRITIHPGTYREHGVAITKPVEIVGHEYPTIDGEGSAILSIAADDVTVRGLLLRNVATSYVDDRAAITVNGTSGCVIEDNRIDDAFFGIYLAQASRCRIVGNVLHGRKGTESSSGNGIHLWTSRSIVIERNTVSGHRDGIYFEFVHDTRIAENISEGNLRYGLHFMYSDACQYLRNTFRHNGSGVAVMYTKRVEMIGNRFDGNWGPASYGLLLKEIADSRLENNTFVGNTTGLLAEGANRLVATGNVFADNGWAVKLDASTLDARFSANEFLGNTFDVATNSREQTTVFNGNYWDGYQGYDLNGDGIGDVPFHPVRLFSLVVAQHAPAIALLRSAFVAVLDGAERALPSLTPETLVDKRPLMSSARPRRAS